ncbi:3-hydroxyacyl-ACP dehydratase FabZ [Haploplasma axanthum]|uniref:3-hydroxyacyl-[acyl-carrier-protein] dehydratase n=1 Tax=Haploplasma axanthum TaxID=29552 RepID=A0A449BEW5_HAPAX|nr:3-hydroxyacyl-ACP dehydratase FabZ [Haploplasma axanthum]VEU80976.1 (3R)-hydroxymyristoyl-[acyl-carrier-protein] dehydratase [Haploplasma axanthum]
MNDIEKVKSIIPHREPFLFIDEIVSVESGKTCTAIKYVKEDEEFFKGHFPGNPVMPGVLILEAMAQSGAISLMSLEDYKDKLILFAGADKVKFRKSVLPGDKLTLVSEVIKLKRNFGSARTKAYVEGELVSEAIIRFIVG